MDDQQDKQGVHIPTLTCENHEAWFYQMKMKLKGKGIFYTIEQTVEKYAWIANPKVKVTPTRSTSETTSTADDGDKDVDRLTSNFEKLCGIWNDDKKEA